MVPMDNCLESTGGDILEMSCSGIISIPLVIAACHRTGRKACTAARRWEIYYGFHQRGTMGRDTRVTQRVVIICEHLFKVQFRRQANGCFRSRTGGLNSTDVCFLGKAPC